MLERLLEALQEMKSECESRPNGPTACDTCPYNEFCSHGPNIFSELPQDFEHPLLNS